MIEINEKFVHIKNKILQYLFYKSRKENKLDKRKKQTRFILIYTVFHGFTKTMQVTHL